MHDVLGKMKNTEVIKKNYEFRLVLKRGKYYSGKHIECFVMKNNLEKNRMRNSS